MPSARAFSKRSMSLIEFDWDERKRAINLSKHKVDFFDVCKIFFGFTLEKVDDRQDYGEVRINAIGNIGDVIFFVTYTRRETVYHLISARKASRNEREAYTRTYQSNN